MLMIKIVLIIMMTNDLSARFSVSHEEIVMIGTFPGISVNRGRSNKFDESDGVCAV